MKIIVSYDILQTVRQVSDLVVKVPFLRLWTKELLTIFFNFIERFKSSLLDILNEACLRGEDSDMKAMKPTQQHQLLVAHSSSTSLISSTAACCERLGMMQ
ncbi:hypothetical protein KIN20_021978 [Parelaphostrongylus tenuis]|uniref:Uncharacterized protein n=1 Tax=Parelaphostrongylus tenuis TaxID=148309 RepID=A0AAD5MTG4_PARTN|nr:hypothetical protein KIN20_021978 [Parelaphostrongylus tenuis]